MADNEIHQILKSLRDEIDQSKKHWLMIRVNPLMAGFIMLDYHFKYLEGVAGRGVADLLKRALRHACAVSRYATRE